MILKHLKVYAFGFFAFLMTGLAIAVRILTHKNATLRERAEYAEAKAHVAAVVAKADIKIEEAARKHEEKIKNEVKESGRPAVLDDPNRLWDDPKD